MGSGTKIAELKVTTAQVDSLVEPGRSSWLCCSLVLHTCSCRAREWHFFLGGGVKVSFDKTSAGARLHKVDGPSLVCFAY